MTKTQPPEGLSASFGDIIENGWASADNPTRTGIFVREGRRMGRMNAGRFFEVTDGKGHFWELPLGRDHKITVRPAARSTSPAPASEQDDGNEEFQRGLSFVIVQLAHAVGVQSWREMNGSESVEGDVYATIMEILRGARLYDDEDGTWARLPTSPAPDPKAGEAPGDGWHRFSEEPAPKGMFLWARQNDTGWGLGLAYWTVSGVWRCAYGSNTMGATHWHALPEPPHA